MFRSVAILALMALPAHAQMNDDLPRLAFGEDGSAMVSVTWNTEVDAEQVLEFRRMGEAWQRQVAERQPWAQMNRWVHTVWVDGLFPDARYEYRVGVEGAFSEVYQFRTGPDDPCASFNFVALGDDRSQDDFGVSLNFGPILQESLESDPAFILNGGDLVNDGDDPSQWFNWLAHTGPRMASVAHMPTIGNHDDDRVEGDGAMYNILFSLPRNEQTGTEDYYYFTYGDLIAVSLSSTTFKGMNFQEQAAWLDQVLEENPRRWKIVFLHHPIYTSDLVGLLHPPNEVDQNAALVPIFDAHHVDLVIQSHNHWYQRFHPSFGGGGDEEPSVVDDPSQGTVYVTTGGAGAFTVDIGDILGLLDIQCALTVGCAALRGEHHYMDFELTPNRMSVTVKATAAQNFGMDPNNREVLDEFIIDKVGAERMECADPPPPQPDAAVPPIMDAATPTPDAAAPTPDAAAPTPDAAPNPDAASPNPDAAAPATDAAPMVDANRDPPPNTRFDTGLSRPRADATFAEEGASDGCGCRAGEGGHPGWALLLLLGLVRRRNA